VHPPAPQREGGRRASRVEEVPAGAREILDLAGRLIGDGVELVVMESTSDEKLRRLSRRLGGNQARCAVGRSILVIIWHLLSDPSARFRDLGPGWHERSADRDRKIRSHLRQLQALGLDVTLTPAALPASVEHRERGSGHT
jgi:hypothetical protein